MYIYTIYTSVHEDWPSQDIVLLRGLCGRLNHSFIAPLLALPTQLQYYCTTIARYSDPLRHPVFMPYTIQYCALQY